MLRKELGHRRLRAPTVAKNTPPPQLIFDNPRSIIIPGSAPDPSFLKDLCFYLGAAGSHQTIVTGTAGQIMVAGKDYQF